MILIVGLQQGGYVRYHKGFTLIEVVVAVGIFGILSIILTTLLVGALRGAKKASATVLVRSEGSFALESITSQLRYIKSITSCTGNQIQATTLTGANLTFDCITSGADSYLASNSARLTSANVAVTACTTVFSCPADLHTVYVTFGLQRAGSALPIESIAKIDFDSEVVLRNN